jgi:hypothetical protein
MYGQLDLSWNYVALPALSVVKLCTVRQVLQRHLLVPGLVAPLGELCTLLAAAQ